MLFVGDIIAIVGIPLTCSSCFSAISQLFFMKCSKNNVNYVTNGLTFGIYATISLYVSDFHFLTFQCGDRL